MGIIVLFRRCRGGLFLCFLSFLYLPKQCGVVYNKSEMLKIVFTYITNELIPEII